MTYNCIKTSTTAAAIGTGNATVVSTAAARARPLSDIPVGKQVVLRIEDESGTDWELSLCTILSATTFSRDVVLNGINGPGGKTNFGAGAKTVQCVIAAEEVNALAGVFDVAFSQSISLTRPGTAYMPQYSVTGALAFTPAAGAVKGAFAYGGIIADGASAVTFPGFKQAVGSADYDNRAGILNVLEFSYDGYNYWYAVSQAVGAVPVDTIAPTITAAAVANSTPTIVTLTASEALDPNNVPAASAFAVTGHTITGVAVAGTAVNLTVSAAFANGEAARTVSYTQPGSAGLRDQAGNLMASFSGRAIANNVQPADVTPPTVSSAQVASASPTVIQITMSESLAASAPPSSAFAVSGGKTVSSLAISGAVVSLTCSAAYVAGDTITVTYTQPSGNPRLQDAAGNVTASFGPVGVTNNIQSAQTTVRLTGTKSADVTESASAPWTYTSTGGATGATGAVSAAGISGDGTVIWKVNTTSGDFMVGVSTSAATVKYDASDTQSLWSNGGGAYRAFGNKDVTSSVPAANGDLIRFRIMNTATKADYLVDYDWAVSKDGGATWTTIVANDSGTNGLRKLPQYYRVVPGANASLSVVSATGAT